MKKADSIQIYAAEQMLSERERHAEESIAKSA